MALSWTDNPNLTSGNWWGVAYMAGVLWAWEEVFGSSLGGPVVESNDDGTTWTAPSFISTSFKAYAMAWNGSNIIVAVGDGISGGSGTRSYVRTSGTWANGTMPSAALWHSVAWNGTTFCAVKENGAATSAAGAAWTARALTIGSFPIIIAHGTTFVAVSSNDDKARRSTNNGVSFGTHNMPSTGWQGLATNGSTIVAVGLDKIAYSTDGGQTWTETAVTGNWRSVAWDGAQFCAVPSFGTSDYATSPDGIAWTTGALPDPAFATYMTVNGADTFYYLWFNELYKSAAAVAPAAGGSPFFHFTFGSG